MERNLVYVTCSSVEEARRIGKQVVSTRLAACANILDGMQSFYWWENALQEGREAILLAKTRASLVPRLIEAIKAMHSYECPCIVSLPIVGGFKPFLDWIGDETGGEV